MEKLELAIKEMLPHLDEKQKRLYLGSEAKKIGYGGNSIISKLSNVSRPTIIQGIKELALPLADIKKNVVKTRVKGGGRKKLTVKNDKLLEALESLVEPVTRGCPESPLRWTCKSIRTIESELKKQGYIIGKTVVGELLHELGYSLQSNSKMLEGNQHIDRNAQFEYINNLSNRFLERNMPVISVDTKKKELIGNYKNNGKEYRPKKDPREVEGHDFGTEKATPGVYDIGENNGFVNVGKSCDTGEFAVESIRKWWNCMGKLTYPNQRKLLINADGGGSNGYRLHLWKKELQNFSNQTNMQITVCHFPPGTSKWNKIEHRLFSQISLNWKGIPLESYEIVVNLIGSVKTTKGMRVIAELDEHKYQKGIKVSKSDIEKINIKRHLFHGEWNYTILPNCKT